VNAFFGGTILALFGGFHRSRTYKGALVTIGEPKCPGRDEIV